MHTQLEWCTRLADLETRVVLLVNPRTFCSITIGHLGAMYTVVPASPSLLPSKTPGPLSVWHHQNNYVHVGSAKQTSLSLEGAKRVRISEAEMMAQMATGSSSFNLSIRTMMFVSLSFLLQMATKLFCSVLDCSWCLVGFWTVQQSVFARVSMRLFAFKLGH